MPDRFEFSDDAALLAADVVSLTAENIRLERELQVTREMLSVVLDIANQSITHITELMNLADHRK